MPLRSFCQLYQCLKTALPKDAAAEDLERVHRDLAPGVAVAGDPDNPGPEVLWAAALVVVFLEQRDLEFPPASLGFFLQGDRNRIWHQTG
jgi:hypothetical protein